jgi:hypothetical protein
MRKKEATITISISTSNDREKEVDADVYGKFAIHPPRPTGRIFWSSKEEYTVTHVETGYAVCRIYGRRLAARTAIKLNEAIPEEGDITRADFGKTIAESSERYKEFGRKAVQIIRQMKLSEKPA